MRYWLQGNRLDWPNSGLVCGLLFGGLVILAALVPQIRLAEQPWMNAGFLLTPEDCTRDGGHKRNEGEAGRT